MKRTTINSTMATLSLILLVLAIFQPEAQAATLAIPISDVEQPEISPAVLHDGAEQQPQSSAYFLPPTRRRAATQTVTASMTDNFDAPPEVAGPITFGFDSISKVSGDEKSGEWVIDGQTWKGAGFWDSKGTVGVENEQLVITHTNGKIPISYNRHYAFYLASPVPDVTTYEVTINTPPTPAYNLARAGLEFRNIAPSSSASGGDDGSDKVYFGVYLISDNNFGLFGAIRKKTTVLHTYDSGSLLQASDFPVRLQIKRASNTFTFFYTSSTKSSFTTIHSATETMDNSLYLALFQSNDDDNTEISTFSQTVYDDLSYDFPPYQPPGVLDSNWIEKSFNSTADQEISNNQLAFSGNGNGIIGTPDGGTGGGYTYLYQQDTFNTTNEPFEAIVQVLAAPTTENGVAGLEFRSVNGGTGTGSRNKVAFGIRGTGSGYELYAVYRINPDGLNENGVETISSKSITNFPSTPVWLRIARDGGTNIFHFYYSQQNDTPSDSQWQEMDYETIAIDTDLYVGMIHTSGQGGTSFTSLFDNFTATSWIDHISGLEIEIPTEPSKLGDVVSFTASITTGSNVSYSWDFGDGNTSTGKVVTHTYANYGTYIATVTATNDGSTSVVTSSVTVPDMPIAGLKLQNPNPTGVFNTVISFTASVTQGSNVSYSWDFGDGQTGTGSPVNHTYGSDGTYTAIVTAQNSINTEVLTFNVTIFLVADAEITGLSAFNNGPTQLGQSTTFTSSITAGDNVKYMWDFGDTQQTSMLSGLDNTTHVYASPGTYEVTLTAENNNGQKTTTTNVLIYGEPTFSLTKSGPVDALPDAPVTYTLILLNSGNDIAKNIVISDVVPTGATYVSGGTLQGNVVSWSVDPLDSGEQVSVEMVVSSGAVGQITNDTFSVVAIDRLGQKVTATGQDSVTTYIEDEPDAKIVSVVDDFNSSPINSDWIEKSFDSSADQVISNNQLAFSGDGAGIMGTPDGQAGYTYFYQKNKFNTNEPFDAMVQLLDAPTIENGVAGLEFRSDDGGTGTGSRNKIALGIRWNGSGHELYAVYRINSSGSISSEVKNISSKSITNLPSTPVWLRIARDTGTNIFHFYYSQQSSEPTKSQWQEMTYTASGDNEIDIDTDLFVGLFHASGQGGTSSTSLFDNFEATSRYIYIYNFTVSHDAPRGPGDVVNFTTSIDAGSNVNYSWDFGDNITTTGQTASHSYSSYGTYIATITATNGAGTSVITSSVVITDTAIAGLALQDPNPTGLVDKSVSLAASVTEGSNPQYSWDFGDGQTGTGNPVNHTYSSEGTYTAIVTAQNSINTEALVFNVIITSIPDDQITGLTAFNNGPTLLGQTTKVSSTIVNGTNVKYMWDFGDGQQTQSGTEFDTTSHVYNVPGTYNVTLTADNNNNSPKTTFDTVLVYGEPEFRITNSGPTAVIPNEPILYTLTIFNIGNDIVENVVISDVIPTGATHLSGGTLQGNVVSWSVDSLDAGEQTSVDMIISSATVRKIVNNTTVAGTNRLDQTVTGEASFTTYVEEEPIAEAGPLQVVGPDDSVSLDGAGSRDLVGNPLTYRWRQLSGDTVALVGYDTPTATFKALSQVGTLVFELKVTSLHGLQRTDTTTVTITKDPYFLIEKQAPAVINPSQELTYTITISNIGTSPANQLVISDTLPDGAGYLRGGNINGNIITWSLDSLARHEQHSVTFVVTGSPGSASLVNREYSVASAEGTFAKGVDVTSRINKHPQASAGADQHILPKVLVILNGQGSTDPEGDKLSYQWTQTVGKSVFISGSDSEQASFISPDSYGDLNFMLTVTDEHGLSHTDIVTVTVAPWTYSVAEPVPFSCTDSEANIIKLGGARLVNAGNSTIYVGTNSNWTPVDLENPENPMDPIVVKFTNGNRNWCKVDYEDTVDDNSGYAALWDGEDLLYGVFNAHIPRGGADFQRFAINGWLNAIANGSSGGNNGLRMGIIAKLNPNTGEATKASYLTALDYRERSNSFIVRDLYFSDATHTRANSSLIIKADTLYSPRQLDKTAYYCSGAEPIDYTLELSLDLTTAITATAPNCFDLPTPPDGVTIKGAATAVISTVYQLTADVTPIEATQPLSYTWFPEPQFGQGTAIVSYTWQLTGSQTISVVVLNEVDTVSTTKVISVAKPTVIPPTGVTISGADTGQIKQNYNYTATASPADATSLTYLWSPEPSTGQGSAVVSYNWPSAGQQSIMVMASNSDGMVTATKLVTINSDMTVAINGPVSATINMAHLFSATVLPPDVTTSLTYTWSPEPESGQGTSEVSYSWSSTGSHTISLTVSNSAGMQSASQVVQVDILNLPPLALVDAGTTLINTPITMMVLENDSDPEGDPLILVSVEGATNGAVIPTGNGAIYTPNSDFIGVDSFSYTVTDGHGTATAQVLVVVSNVDEQVVATPVNTGTTTTIVITGTPAITIQIPSEVYTQSFVMVTTMLTQTTHLPPDGYNEAGVYFIIDIYVDGVLQQPYKFSPPISITLSYLDEEMVNIDERTLKIFYWNETTELWADDGVTSLPPDTVNNTVTAIIGHTTEYALFGETKGISTYLPIMTKQQ
ncbi:PKD domain-containing protein [Anaerolineales bacterium HSG6]|nr:PKD domain-containing protein [Anaerolineales bacterium HSG6]